MKHALVVICLLGLSSCSSLLYYPTHVLHFSPERRGLHPEEVNFQSADGTNLFAWLFRHEGAPKKPKAVFVFYHGNGENLSSHYIGLIWALRQGYDFFIFDYRGYGRSEGETTPKGTVADGEAALRWVHAHYADTPLVIYGQSLGGTVALRNAVDLKDEVALKAVIIESSFASYEEVGRRTLASGVVTWPFQWLAWLALSDRYAPEGDIAKIAPVPLLVMHAESDQTVPFRCGEEVFEQAADPREFWKVPGAGHADAFLRFGDLYQKKVMAWLNSALALSPR
ncbi:MAG: alpha/beta hydrolase [Bdellovibrionota bacterium]